MKKILAFIVVLLTLVFMCVYPASAFGGTKETATGEEPSPYSEIFEHWFANTYTDYKDVQPLYEYIGSYYWTNTDNETPDEATPDFVLSKISSPFVGDASAYGVYGEYIVGVGGYYYPYCLGYHIYLPSSGEILTLREAWDRELDGIADIIADVGLLIGDADRDGIITIKDATYIQKREVGIIANDKIDLLFVIQEDSVGAEVSHLYDFNRDSTVNIKDVTAIQKYIAGIV